ncbi:Uncharacterized conserved protein [Janthinobacterium sp. Marseille]|nr:Uncharacterized conserved protein [Janthinobacterium sp. Marseille]
MLYDEFQRQLGKAGLTIGQFSKLIKMNPNSISNCRKKGLVPTHLAVIATLMGEMTERKVEFEQLLSAIEITEKKPRGRTSNSKK